MNKNIYYLMCAVAVLATACQQEQAFTGKNGKTITKTMYVEPEEWLAVGESKTAYNPSDNSIRWSGDESFAVYYGNSTESTLAGKVTSATRVEGNTFKLDHDAIEGAEKYDYCAITPDLPTMPGGFTSDNSNAVNFFLSPVQNPTAETFDPYYDILVAKAVRNVGIDAPVAFTEFKRLCTPLRVKLTDAASLLGTEKIRTATLSFSEKASGNAPYGLTGRFTITMGDDYDACGFTSASGVANYVSAIYPSGLEKAGNEWQLWYLVNPVKLSAGCVVTLDIVTDTKSFTLKKTLPGEFLMAAGKGVNIPFSLSEDDHINDGVIYQDFSTAGSLENIPAASDGSNLSWKIESCSIGEYGSMPKALVMASEGSIVLPEIADRQITKIRLYPHAANNSKNNKIILNNMPPVAFSTYTLNENPVVELAVPDSEYGKQLKLSFSNETFGLSCKITGIAIETGDITEGAWDGTSSTAYAGGSGTADDPYQIATPGQLALMRDDINSASKNVTASYILAADLDLNNVEWTPAGVKTDIYFNGVFDGNGHSISGLNINAGSGDTYAGLFGYSRGTIKNLTVKEPAVVSASTVATSYTSAIVAQGASITIENCHVSGGKIDVSGATGSTVYCGSMAGQIAGTSITACSSSAELNAGAGNIGGIVGFVRGTTSIAGCYSKATINATNFAGGIIGGVNNKATLNVTACYSLSVFDGSPKNVGGISASTVGTGTYTNCFYTNPAEGSVAIEGVSSVAEMGETEISTMNESLSSLGWQFVAAESDSAFPYVISKK